MNINAVLNFDTADFTHELKSATKVKKTPTKKKNLIRRGIVPTLVTDYGCGKVALNFGENILAGTNVCRAMYVENPGLKEKVVSFINETTRSSSELMVTPSQISIAPKSKATVYVNFMPTTASKEKYFGKISFKVSGMKLPLEVKAIATVKLSTKSKALKKRRQFGGSKNNNNNNSKNVNTHQLKILSRIQKTKKSSRLNKQNLKQNINDDVNDKNNNNINQEYDINESMKKMKKRQVKKYDDEKLRKILNGPIGIPKRKSMPLTQPKSFHLGSKKSLKVVDDLPVEEVKKKVRAAQNSTMKKSTTSSNWKLELKKLGQSKFNSEEQELDDEEFLGEPEQVETQPEPKKVSKKVNHTTRPSKTRQQSSIASNNKHTKVKRRMNKQALREPVAQRTSKMTKKNANIAKSICVRRVLYDENWAEKQISAFTVWLNHTFYPAEYDMYAENADKNGSGKSNNNENTNSTSNNILSAPGGGAPAVAEDHFKVLLQKRRQAKVRHRAFRMFHSQEMDNICYALDKEVAESKLKVRTDRELYADLGLRSEIIGMLMSYNPVWLRLGLETTYGEVIPMNKRAIQDAGRSVLKQFVKRRVLQDPGIAETFKTTKQGVFGKGYAEALARVTLRRFLMVVLFLDKAKQTNILGNGPCLFNVSSKIKSSRDMLITFAKKFLSGEGDIIRHLSLMGYNVEYKQKLLDEFDYTVKNLASDLRDGVRLCRLVEMIHGNRTERPLSRKLRMPAGSLLQKKHNVKLALNKLKESKLSLKTKSGRSFRNIGVDDIVQAHKENTLTLLWRIMIKFKLEKMLPEAILHDEIKIIKAAMSEIAINFVHDQEKRDSTMKNNDTNTTSLPPVALLLKDWVRCVCARDLIPVYDFSSSFADGRALCTLVNFYHPELLSKSSINDETTANINGSKQSYATKLNDNRWCDDAFDSDVELPAHKYAKIISNESENFNNFNNAIKSLGSVPATLNDDYCSEYVPEEKSVVVCVAYLCSRLLESSKEIHAAVKLQGVWRLFYRKKMLLKHRASGMIIKNAFARNLIQQRKHRFQRSILLFQSLFRTFKCKKVFKLTKKMCVFLQKTLRMKLQQAKFQLLLQTHRVKMHSVLKIQTAFRRKMEHKKYMSRRNSVIKIQTYFRKYLLMNKYQQMQVAVIVLQKRIRGFVNKLQFKNIVKRIVQMQTFVRSCQAKALKQTLFKQMEMKQYHAASTIQKVTRMRQSYNKFHQMKHNAIKIQSFMRKYVVAKKYKMMLKCIIQMQTFVRSCQAKALKQTLFKQMEMKQYHAASTIQKVTRMRQSYFKFHQMKHNAIKIQSFMRKYIAMKNYNIMLKCIIQIQLVIRKNIAEKKYKKQQSSIVKIQSFIRKANHQTKYKSIKSKIVSMQQCVRTFIARQRLHELQMAKEAYKLKSTCLIQSIFRGYVTRKKGFSEKISIVKLQTMWRKSFASRRFKAYKVASIKIQSVVRMYNARKSFLQKRNAAIIIQNKYRQLRFNQRYANIKSSCIQIQTIYRARKAFQKYQSLKTNIVTIQCFVRRFIQKQTFMKVKNASVCLQKWYLRILSQRLIKMKEKAAILFQKIYRGSRARKQYVLLKTYKKYEEEQYNQRVNAANVIRRLYKSYKVSKSVKILQQFTQIIIAKRHVRFKKKCILKLQSVIRGIIARRRSSNLLIEARIRVQKAIERGKEEEKLGNRTDVALNVLLTSNNLSGVKRAAVTLEVSTKISHVCAKRFVEKGAVAIIYRLIRSCNRSEPHRAVLSHALNVLRQVSSFEIILNNFSPSREYRIETLVELLQTFRDQPIRLRQILYLIADVCKDEEFARNLSKSKDLMKRLSGVLRLLKRKAKSESKENAFGHRRGNGTSMKKVKKQQALSQRNIVTLEQLLGRINNR